VVEDDERGAALDDPAAQLGRQVVGEPAAGYRPERRLVDLEAISV
jgi:hypothetical protein